jgi:hypothetical protein
MSEPLVTLMECPFCEQPVQAYRHTPEECLGNMKRERDEAQTLLSQVGFLVSEAMKRMENENIDAAYDSLQIAIDWMEMPPEERAGLLFSETPLEKKTDAREGD